MIDAIVGQAHYLKHMLPVWEAIPEGMRGTLYIDNRTIPLVDGAVPFRTFHKRRSDPNPVLIAGFSDLQRTGGRQVILMEHGCGQSYSGDPRSASHPAYAGGTGRHNVVAFLCPNEHSAERNRAAYPDRIVEIVGSPRLADLQGVTRHPRSDKPVVAFTFHWDADICPETRSGWAHFHSAVREMVDSDEFVVLGHAHPRMFGDVAGAYIQMGAEPVKDFEEVLARADVLVADNTSAMYEFAAIVGPTVVLNSPWYRRGIDHGLRFWEAASIGPQVVDPAAVPFAVRQALSAPWPGSEAALSQVFPPVENPARRAAEVIARVDAQRGRLPFQERIAPVFPLTSVGMI